MRSLSASGDTPLAAVRSLGELPTLPPVAPVAACALSVDILQPVLVALHLTANGGEVRLLERAGDVPTVADLAVVDRADRDHLGGGAGEEGLVGEVEVVAQELLLLHRVAEVAGDGHDRVARDAGEC